MTPDKDDQMYIYQLFGISTPRRVKAINDIRNKIGPMATIKEDQIIKAQQKIDKKGIDYQPYANQLLSRIEDLLIELKATDYDREREYNRVAAPIAQIKGESGMFGNDFVSDVSARILNFMEHYHRLDDDVLEILQAYCRCVRLAYQHNVSIVDSGDADRLMKELNAALDRYHAKFRRKTET